MELSNSSRSPEEYRKFKNFDNLAPCSIIIFRAGRAEIVFTADQVKDVMLQKIVKIEKFKKKKSL